MLFLVRDCVGWRRDRSARERKPPRITKKLPTTPTVVGSLGLIRLLAWPSAAMLSPPKQRRLSVHLDDFRPNLQKRHDEHGLQFVVGAGASESDMVHATNRLETALPKQVRLFYSKFDGLVVNYPRFEILPISRLTRNQYSLIHFATADNYHSICFDSRIANAAGQWDIISQADGYVITHSMASFWSNTIWKWIDREIPFWRADWHTFT